MHNASRNSPAHLLTPRYIAHTKSQAVKIVSKTGVFGKNPLWDHQQSGLVTWPDYILEVEIPSRKTLEKGRHKYWSLAANRRASSWIEKHRKREHQWWRTAAWAWNKSELWRGHGFQFSNLRPKGCQMPLHWQLCNRIGQQEISMACHRLSQGRSSLAS